MDGDPFQTISKHNATFNLDDCVAHADFEVTPLRSCAGHFNRFAIPLEFGYAIEPQRLRNTFVDRSIGGQLQCLQ